MPTTTTTLLCGRKEKKQHLADMLPRVCLPKCEEKDGEIDEVNMCSHLPIGSERIQNIQQETQKDDVLSELKAMILQGWPEERKMVPELVVPCYNFADELSVQDGMIFKGERMVIPKSLRSEMKQEIHRAHGGIQACLRRAREAIYWPGMTGEIKHYVSVCEACRMFEVSNQKETMIPHEIPERQWEKVGVDTFEFDGCDYLVTVDYFSNYWELDKLEENTSATIIKKLKQHFTRFGIPCKMNSDNANQFTSSKFRKFAKAWDIEQYTSSPHHPNANGMAESAVKTAKKILKKCKVNKQDTFLAILNHRNTPSQEMDTSPVQRLLNRRTRTLLPTVSKLLESKGKDLQHKRKRLKHKQDLQASSYNKGAKDLPSFSEGAVVRMKPYKLGDKVWEKAVVTKRMDVRSYEICAEDGNIYRRNRVHLKATNEDDPFVQKTAEKTLTQIPAEKNCELPVLDVPKTTMSDVLEQAKPVEKETEKDAITRTRSGRQVKIPVRYT